MAHIKCQSQNLLLLKSNHDAAQQGSRNLTHCRVSFAHSALLTKPLLNHKHGDVWYESTENPFFAFSQAASYDPSTLATPHVWEDLPHRRPARRRQRQSPAPRPWSDGARRGSPMHELRSQSVVPTGSAVGVPRQVQNGRHKEDKFVTQLREKHMENASQRMHVNNLRRRTFFNLPRSASASQARLCSFPGALWIGIAHERGPGGQGRH